MTAGGCWSTCNSVDYADFGRYLSQQRELRGVSREDVARLTRIPLNLLIALEMGEVARLPGSIFTRHYIRAYARAIGVAPEEAVLRYEEIERSESSGPHATTMVSKGRSRAWRWWVAGGIVAAAVGYGILLAFGKVPLPQRR